jgi:uncharacterized membrane protein
MLLTAAPILLWSVSLVFDVASRVDGAPSVLPAIALPLIGAGVFVGLAAAMVGFVDLLTVQPGSRPFRSSLVHLAVDLVVVGAYIGNFCWRDAILYETVAVPMGPLVLSAISLALLAVAGSLYGRAGVALPVGSLGFSSGRRSARRPEARRLPR